MKLNYSVFGLGNKQYEHFNRMGKSTDQGLELLGGSRIMDIVLGDDDANMEEDFEKWRENMWPILVDKFLPKTGGFNTDNVKASRINSMDSTRHEVTDLFQVIEDCQAKSPRDFLPKEINKSTKYFFNALKVIH